MNIKLLKSDKFVSLLVLLLLASVFTGIYFLYLYPKMEMVSQKESELRTQEKLLSALQNKVNGSTSNSLGSTVELQKKVPVKPLAQQLLLQIEEAEVLSGSFVVNVTFESNEEAEGQQNQTIQTDPNQSSDQMNNQNGSDTNTPTSENGEIALPAGVKKLTATLNVESPTYFEFEKFITKIENANRIIVVETIDFNAGDEIISTNQKDTPLTYQVKLSAFYMPTLTDLLDHLPKIESPEPGNKKNPLNNFGDYSKDKVETVYVEPPADTEEDTIDPTLPEPDVYPDLPYPNDDQLVEDDQPETTNPNIKIVKYTVRQGDTLEKIAVEFYNSKDAVTLIKEFNNLTSNTISVGQVLEIPLEI